MTACQEAAKGGSQQAGLQCCRELQAAAGKDLTREKLNVLFLANGHFLSVKTLGFVHHASACS